MPRRPISSPGGVDAVRDGQPPSRRRRLLGRALRTARALAITYVVLIASMYFLQGWLILPGRRSQGTAEAAVRPVPGTEMVRLRTADGEPIVALFAPALSEDGRPLPDAARRPTLLLFYGTGSWLSSFLPRVERLRRLGVNVLTPEYVGYGLSGGSASEAGCYATADAAYAHLLTRKDVDPQRIIIAGFSLGGAVAIDLASRKPASGLVTFSTFTTMTDMAYRQQPYVPCSLLLQQRFESVRKIRQVRCPILLIHGASDGFIPISMMRRLARAATVPVTQVAVPGADHESLFSVGGDEPVRHLNSFLRAVRDPIAPAEPASSLAAYDFPLYLRLVLSTASRVGREARGGAGGMTTAPPSTG
jgi:fermentation-respiration switch protein FrsA (DUF1100 family)